MTDFWRRLAAAPPDVPQALAVDPDGFMVYMSRTRWETHILPGHEHILFVQDFLIPAISNPDDREYEDPSGQVIRYFRKIPSGRHALFTRSLDEGRGKISPSGDNRLQTDRPGQHCISGSQKRKTLMSSQPVLRTIPLTFEYDAGEDVLHIFLDGSRDDSGFITFVNLIERPEIFLRVNQWDSQIQGFSVKPASIRLGTKAPGQEAMRQLADELVLHYGRMEPEELSRHQYKVVHKLDDDPNVTWSYEPFSEILYVNLRRDIGHTEYDPADDQPDVIVRRDPQDNDRVVGFMVEHIPRRFGTEMPNRGQLRALARELVARYAPGT